MNRSNNACNVAAVLYGKSDLRVEQRPVPKIGHTDVLVQVECTGICGTDVHLYTHAKLGPDMVLKDPMVLGHEASGTVIEVGSSVSSLKPGDRIAMDNVFPCLTCSFCKKGRQNLCETRLKTGSLQNFAAYPAVSCHKLPGSISFEEGALIEPLSIGVYACERGSVKLGDKILICGAGTIGLVSAISAFAFGASEVCLTDISMERLIAAKRIIPRVKTCCVLKCNDAILEIITQLGGRPDVAIECSGAQQSTNLCLQVCKTGGKMVLVGFGEAAYQKVPFQNHVVRREIDITSVFARDATIYPKTIEALRAGRIDLKGLITHRKRLNQIHEAIDIAKTGRDGAIKVMINLSEHF